MNFYGWVLLGETLLAMLALGLAGGWVLWPFRREDRPYLWLAAPLAGLFALGGSLAVLYFGLRLPFRWCLWLGLAAHAVATGSCLARGRPQLAPLGQRVVATVVVVTTACWATLASNRTAIDHREPTVAVMDGSDMFGYAITAEWLRRHRASEPPRPTEPFEVMVHANLYRDRGRPLAFALTAAAGEARGTSSLFSYDWASGVILAAAILALAGLFAENGLVLVLLVAGGATSNWLANARTGYMARSIAYPGCILVAGLFLAAARSFTGRRSAIVAGSGAAVAFAIAPVVVTAVLALVLGGFIAALPLVYLFARWGRDRTGRFPADVLKPALVAGLVYLVTVLPAFAVYYAPRGTIAKPGVPTEWTVVIPVALDLEPPAMPLLRPATETWLLFGCAVLLLASMGFALRYRRSDALALAACALIVPASWLLGQPLLHTFQGVTYPLTLAGAALAVPPTAGRRGLRQTAGASLLLFGLVALRIPPLLATADRYVYSVQPYRAVVLQSDVQAIRAIVGREPVDVAVGHYADNHMALAELVPHRVQVRLRSPAWDRSLRNWARASGTQPDLLAPKARFALVERNAYAPPGTERWVGTRLKLIEDRDAVTVVGVAGTQEMSWDTDWRPSVWVGNTPTTFLIHNGTGHPRAFRLVGDTSAGPAHPDRGRRTLVYRLDDQSGALALPNENRAAIPLRLAPGLNRVDLTVAEPADPPAKPHQPLLLLEFRNWRLEPIGATSSRHDPRSLSRPGGTPLATDWHAHGPGTDVVPADHSPRAVTRAVTTGPSLPPTV